MRTTHQAPNAKTSEARPSRIELTHLPRPGTGKKKRPDRDLTPCRGGLFKDVRISTATPQVRSGVHRRLSRAQTPQAATRRFSCFRHVCTYSRALRATGDAAFFGCFSASNCKCPWIDWRRRRFRLIALPFARTSGRFGYSSRGGRLMWLSVFRPRRALHYSNYQAALKIPYRRYYGN